MGAAIQAGVLSGDLEDVLLLDVTPLSLGVETEGGVLTSIIPKNTTLPTAKSQIFSTTEDSQELVRIHVLQGERELATDNMSLGRFELVGLPPAPRGVPQIEVTFSLDTDGVAHVSARDLGTGLSQSIEVTASSGLTDEQVQELVSQAADHKADDLRKREEVDLRNKLTGLVYATEKTLKEFGQHVEDTDLQGVRGLLERVEALEPGAEPEELREVLQALSASSFELTEKVYAQLGENPESPKGPQASNSLA